VKAIGDRHDRHRGEHADDRGRLEPDLADGVEELECGEADDHGDEQHGERGPGLEADEGEDGHRRPGDDPGHEVGWGRRGRRHPLGPTLGGHGTHPAPGLDLGRERGVVVRHRGGEGTGGLVVGDERVLDDDGLVDLVEVVGRVPEPERVARVRGHCGVLTRGRFAPVGQVDRLGLGGDLDDPVLAGVVGGRRHTHDPYALGGRRFDGRGPESPVERHEPGRLRGRGRAGRVVVGARERQGRCDRRLGAFGLLERRTALGTGVDGRPGLVGPEDPHALVRARPLGLLRLALVTVEDVVHGFPLAP
jgi:hypothetical protein